jgi:hypothetical protein
LISPRALNGDKFEAKTGDISSAIQLPPVNDGNEPGTALVSLTIVDDISKLTRIKHWFKETGWKFLLLLLLLLLLFGYIRKRRFPTKGTLGVKRNPQILGTPTQIGPMVTGNGNFSIHFLRRLLPFVADTATLSYVPIGVAGFPKMELKAGRQKTMVLMNWKQIATRNNTEIDGVPLDDEVQKAPFFRASSRITATDVDMSYDMTPNVN